VGFLGVSDANQVVSVRWHQVGLIATTSIKINVRKILEAQSARIPTTAQECTYVTAAKGEEGMLN
jgi:hypothetical protein